MTDLLTLIVRDVPIEMSLDEWEEVGRTIRGHVLDRQRQLEDEQRAAGQVWHSVYYRYGQQHEDEHFSFKDAAVALRSGWEYGELSDVGIRLPDGRLIESEFGVAVDPDAATSAVDD